MTEDDFFMFHKEDLPSQAFPLMEEIRREGKLCDVTLKVGDHRISAHRIVLSATIPYFHAMFTHDMVEAKQEEITIKEIEASAMEAFVNFAYNGKVQISTANVQALLIGASFLHLHSIKQACCDFMEDRLQPHNAIGVRQFADRFMCSTLVEAANQYLYVHFVDVSKCNEFVLLDKEDLINIVSRNDLHVNTEEQVFEACMAWVNHDLDNRREDLPDLLVNVRMPLMTPQYLSDIVAQDELVKCSLQCRDLIDEAKDYHLMPERRMQLQTFRTRPRCCTDVVGIIYAVGGLTSSGDSISTVECFNPVIRRWQITQPMKTLRSRVGVAVLNGKLYAIGGYDGSERLNTVEVFDPESNHWKLVRPMNCKRSALGAAALDGKLYVCGGYDGVSSLSSVECYDPLANSWSMVSNMNKHRSAAGVTVLDGHIYALGGHDGLSIFDCAETYNKMKRTWTRIATMLSKRCRLGVAPINGKIVVCGGYNGSVFLKTVESYDPATNQWSSLSSMLMERSRVTLVANVGKLYAVGGYDGFTNLNTMELYDPETDAWSMSVAMCAHEGGVGVGVIPLNTTE